MILLSCSSAPEVPHLCRATKGVHTDSHGKKEEDLPRIGSNPNHGKIYGILSLLNKRSVLLSELLSVLQIFANVFQNNLLI